VEYIYSDRALDLSVCVDITILLALSVYQLIVSDILPVSSANVPVIGQSAVLHFYMPNIYYATIPFSSQCYANYTVQNAV